MDIQTIARRTLRKSAKLISLSDDKRASVHFLHIGKNAGNQMLHIAKQVNKGSRDFRIVMHPHSDRLLDLPAGDRFFFSIRSPESRFKSGFYSRKRKGQPRNNDEWTAYEERAFTRFEHANDLAEALFEEGERGFHAMCAIKSISHCSMEQINWFDSAGFFFEVNPPVFILRQERFADDLKQFVARLGFGSDVSLTEDRVTAHKNDYSAVPPLSEKAARNLFDWYRMDFEFYRRCEEWIERQQAPANAS